MKKIALPLLVLVLFCCAVFVIGGTPFFLNFVKDKLVTLAHDYIGEQVTIRSLKGNVFYSLEAQEIRIDDALYLDRLQISYSSIQALFGKIDVKKAVIDGLRVDINRADSLVKRLSIRAKKQMRFEIRIGEISIINSEFSGMLNGQPLHVSLSTKGAIDNRGLLIDTLVLKTNHSSLILKGYVPLQDEQPIDIYYSLNLAVDDVSIKDVTGSFISSGDVKGTLQAPKITSRAEFNVTAMRNRFSGVSQTQWQMPKLDSLKVTATIDAEMPFTQHIPWHITLSKQNAELLVKASSPHGVIELTSALTGTLDNPKLKADLSGWLQYKELQQTVRGTISYNNATLLLKDFSIAGDTLSARCDAILTTKDTATINANVIVACEDIGCLKSFFKTPSLGGTAQIASHITGPLSNPSAISTLTLHNAAVGGEKIDEASFGVELKDSIFNLTAGWLQSPRGLIRVAGSYNHRDSTFSLCIASDSLVFQTPEIFGSDTIPVSGVVGLDVDFHGSIRNPQGKGQCLLKDIAYDTRTIGNFDLSFALIDRALHLTLSNDAKSINLETQIALYTPHIVDAHVALRHFDFARYIATDKGYVTATIRASGEIAKPEVLTSNVIIESVYVSKDTNQIHNIDTVEITLDKGIVHVRACTLSINNNKVYLQGRVPIQSDKVVDMSCRTAQLNLAAFSVLPHFPEMKGLFSLDMRVKGTRQNPDISGVVRLDNVGYSLPGISLDSINSVLRFTRNDIIAEYIKGRVNNGHAHMQGMARLSQWHIDTVSAQISLDKIDMKDEAFGFVDFSGNLETWARNDTYMVNGEIAINKAVYDVPFNLQTITRLLTTANRPVPEQKEILKRIYCDIGITTPGAMRITNNVADVEVDADLQAKGFLSRLNVNGTITTPRKGTLRYLGKQFDIVRAIIQFDNPYTIDPTIDLEASRHVSSVDGEFDIYMYLTGTVEKWQLELVSDPPVPEQDIISLLLISRRRPGTYLFAEVKSIDLKGVARDYTEMLIKGTVERQAEQTFGLEKVKITGDLADPKTLDIGIEKRVTNRLSLIYGSGIEAWDLRRIGMLYDITDNMSVFTIHDQENFNSSVDLDVHFELK